MKKIIYTFLICLFSIGLFAQNPAAPRAQESGETDKAYFQQLTTKQKAAYVAAKMMKEYRLTDDQIRELLPVFENRYAALEQVTDETKRYAIQQDNDKMILEILNVRQRVLYVASANRGKPF